MSGSYAAWIYIGLATICATALWPVNRWIMRSGGRSEVYGFWVSLCGGSVALIAALLARERFDQPAIWTIGAITGIAFAVGFCLIITYCLRIGPTGPTAAMNNMGCGRLFSVHSGYSRTDYLQPILWVSD